MAHHNAHEQPMSEDNHTRRAQHSSRLLIMHMPMPWDDTERKRTCHDVQLCEASSLSVGLKDGSCS